RVLRAGVRTFANRSQFCGQTAGVRFTEQSQFQLGRTGFCSSCETKPILRTGCRAPFYGTKPVQLDRTGSTVSCETKPMLWTDSRASIYGRSQSGLNRTGFCGLCEMEFVSGRPGVTTGGFAKRSQLSSIPSV